MKLYHATYAHYLWYIEREGLRPDAKKSWAFSEDYVYLTSDPGVAISFAETAEDAPDDIVDEIVLLEIDTKDLDLDKLELDNNILSDNDYSFQYNGIIPPEVIVVYEDYFETDDYTWIAR